MKIFKSVPINLGIFTMAIFLVSSGISRAHTPPARELCGVVQEINAPRRLLVLQTAEHPKPLTLAWTRNTLFIKGRKIMDGAQLKAGQSVCVFYQRPFFGKPFMTKVLW